MLNRVLILNTSHNDLGLIKALKRISKYVLATGNRENLIGQKYVDEYIQADYSNKELILKIAVSNKIDAICACCNDFGVMTASYVAEKMNLPGYDKFENTLTIHHKDKFKKFAVSEGILTPRAKEFNDYDKACNYVKEIINFPIIVKPSDLSAGNGISRADTKEQAVKAIYKAFTASREKVVIIETFIEGEQQACCTFLKGGKVTAYCSNNEYSFINPYRVEIDTFPAKGFEKIRPFLINEIESIAMKLGLADGIFHVQYRIKDGKPYILEAMRRVLGNMYSIPAKMVSGFDWDYWEARSLCGLPCENFSFNDNQNGFYSYRAVLANKNGIVKNIKVDNSLDQYIFDECLLYRPGQLITNYSSEPLGFYFMKFNTMEEMHRIMLDNYQKISVCMEGN